MDILKNYLRTIPDFEKQYYLAKEYIRENINVFCDYLKLSPDTHLDVSFPLSDGFVLGLDVNLQTIWVFYDLNMDD